MDTQTQKLENSLAGLIGLRGQKKRQDGYKKSAYLFYGYLKKRNHEFFYRDLIKGFFNPDVKPTTRDRIIKEVLKVLVTDNRIAKETIEKQSKPFFRARELSCIDYGSYATLMARNGYEHIDYFRHEYDKETKTPRTILVDTKPIGEETNEDFDFSSLRQTKSSQNQVCLSNSQKSIVLTRSKNDIQVYIVK